MFMKKKFVFTYENVDIEFIIYEDEIFVNVTPVYKIEKIINLNNKYLRNADWICKLPKNFQKFYKTRKGKHGGGTLISEYLISGYLDWINDNKFNSWIIDRLDEIKSNLILGSYINQKEFFRFKGIIDEYNKIFNINVDQLNLINNELYYENKKINKTNLLNKVWLLNNFSLSVEFIKLLDLLNDNDSVYLNTRYLILNTIDPTDKKYIYTSFVNKTKTYLMKDFNTGLTKIGKAIDPKHRERTLQSEKPTISLFAVCEDNIESELHKTYKDKRVRGEWFNLTGEDIDNIVNKYKFKIIK